MTHRLICLFLFAISQNLLAQDPAGFLFNQHGSVFNPALAGASGSQSVSLAYRQEWINQRDPGYHTALLTYEESMPCSILDFGINALWDQEGDGLLTTYEVSPRVSANLSLVRSHDRQINLRLGGGFSIGRQRITFDRLVFSDQLDPKYGNIFPTTFIPPDEEAGRSYFQPALGFLLQMVLNKMAHNALVVNIGASYHNAYSFGNGNEVGYGKSILGLIAPQSPRFAAHGDLVIVPGSSQSGFISIKPVVLYEKQQNLHYLQYGLEFGLDNFATIGGYMHQQKFFNLKDNTNWFSLGTVFKPYIGKGRADFYLTYSFNISGLRQTVSPLLEIGFKKHFKSSFVCRLTGEEDLYNFNNTKCPLFKVSPAKRKIYENIWY